MNANNAPVRRPPTETHTGDLAIEQKPVISGREDLEGEIVLAPEVLQADYNEALAFAEEPITIRVERTGEKNAPRAIDLWCNGKGAEVLINGRWVALGVFPVGIVVTTKRKYAEILARSKLDNVETDSGSTMDAVDKNDIIRNTSARAPFTVIQDKNPKGVAWLAGVMRVL